MLLSDPEGDAAVVWPLVTARWIELLAMLAVPPSKSYSRMQRLGTEDNIKEEGR